MPFSLSRRHFLVCSAAFFLEEAALFAMPSLAKQSPLVPISGIRLLSCDPSLIKAIGNQTSGRCSWYALRYARTILDGTVCSGAGMWRNGAVWEAAGYRSFDGTREECLYRLYSELEKGRPVIVHVQNVHTDRGGKHPDRVSTWEYSLNGRSWSRVEYPHIATTAAYGHWMCVVGVAVGADPKHLTESAFYTLDPARILSGNTLSVTRMLDGTLWIGNSPLKVTK